ncbi:uncharacterized protein LY79DRAFT_683421 [Colletotrichum navitas]|uniref:Uncharacterized protein n=1 Tax=Colletotrichum navitas TaxID=681940 RepID=A0AAD8QBC2_9PEZI|nr:uncharacterized protein LY79DRAFT_683421 [Colletotrichum navitas]KAK1599422.1 hypothetical protein LY79DRAFT_683421 [Colletotrichum navitas]
MAPGKNTGGAKKKQDSAAASRNKANVSKGKGKAPKVKARASASKSKSTGRTQATNSDGRHKRPIPLDEEGSSDDGTIRPTKRRKGAKAPNPHDYHAVREMPPARDHGASFARKSTALYTWGANPKLSLPSQLKTQPKKAERAVATTRKEKAAVYPTNSPQSGFQPGRGDLSSRMTSPKTPDDENAFPLMKLPIEIRRKIYKEILVVKDPIRVRQGWSAVYPRNRPMVETSILRACRQVRNEAVDVLYGDNTFLYLLRETAKLPATNILGENEIVVHHPLMADELPLSEYEGSSEDEYDEDDLLPAARSARDPEVEIDICRYGHKFRNLMIVAEPNRFDKGYLLSMANAIGVFRNLKPLRARVHTITIEITPIRQVDTGEISFLDFFEKTSEVMRALKGLPCQFIQVLVNTGGGNQECIRLNMKYAARIRRAKRGQEDIWKNDQVMQSYRSMKAGETQRSLEKLSVMVRDIWEGPNGRFVGSRAGDDESDEEDDWGF